MLVGVAYVSVGGVESVSMGAGVSVVALSDCCNERGRRGRERVREREREERGRGRERE